MSCHFRTEQRINVPKGSLIPWIRLLYGSLCVYLDVNIATSGHIHATECSSEGDILAMNI